MNGLIPILLTLFICSCHSSDPLPSCGQFLTQSQSYTSCGLGQNTFSQTSSAFPAFLKDASSTWTKLSFDLALTVTGKCLSSPPYVFFALTITPVSRATVPVELLKFIWASDNNLYGSAGYLQSGGTIVGSQDSAPISPLNPNIDGFGYEFFGSFDLSSGGINYGWANPGLSPYYQENHILNYGADWKFDTTTKFYICSYSNAYNLKCDVQSLSVWATSPGLDIFHYLGGLSPVSLFNFPLNVAGGTTATDASSVASPTVIGSGTGPVWATSGYGLTFTNPSQYFSLPPFVIVAGTSLTRASLTVSFWVYLTSASTSGWNYLCRLSNNAVTSDHFYLLVNNAGTVVAGVGNGAFGMTLTQALPKREWTLITATLILGKPVNYANHNFVHVYFGNTRVSQNEAFNFVQSQVVFASNDIFRIGGPGSFLGTFAKVRIFSPGAPLVTNGDCGTYLFISCPIALGATQADKCLGNKCFSTGCSVCDNGPPAKCLTCQSGYSLNNFVCSLSAGGGGTPTPDPDGDTPKTGTQKAATIGEDSVNAGSRITSAIKYGNTVGVSVAVAGKIFTNIKYLNISYSDELEEALMSWKGSFLTLGFGIDMPDWMEKHVTARPVPYVFSKYDVPSSFLYNLYQQICILLIIVGFYLAARGLEWILKDHRMLHKVLRTVRIATINFMISQLYGIFGDFVLYSTLEYRSMSLGKGLTWLSFIATLGCIAIIGLLFTIHIRLLFRYHASKKENTSQSLEKEQEGKEVFFEDFKDESIHQQAFLLYLIIRDMIFSLILTTLFEYPIIQTGLALCLNITMLIYLFVLQPFRSTFMFGQQLFYEFVWFAVNISVIILAILDGTETSAYDPRKRIGKLVIVVNLIFNFGAFLLMIFSLGSSLWEAYKQYRNKQLARTKSLRHKTDLGLNNNATGLPDIDKTFAQRAQRPLRNLDESLAIEPISNTNNSINTWKENSPGHDHSTHKFLLNTAEGNDTILFQESSLQTKHANGRLDISNFNENKDHNNSFIKNQRQNWIQRNIAGKDTWHTQETALEGSYGIKRENSQENFIRNRSRKAKGKIRNMRMFQEKNIELERPQGQFIGERAPTEQQRYEDFEAIPPHLRHLFVLKDGVFSIK